MGIDEIRKTPQEWSDQDGIVILDPDGWRERFTYEGVTYEPRSIKEKITYQEWNARWRLCTVRGLGSRQPDGTEIEINQEVFQKRAEAFAAAAQASLAEIDPIVVKRTELHEHLLRSVANAAQAKADLTHGSRSDAFRVVVGFRNAEREAVNALSTLIEWEAGLL